MKTDFEIQQDLEDSFNEMLDECYPVVVIGGIHFFPSTILKECDPIAYRVALSDYESTLEENN
jgi:hypothetical protein